MRPVHTGLCVQDLYFGNNQIELLEPEQLSSLTAISVLELRDNKIKNLPEQIISLSMLTRLDLTNNDIGRSGRHNTMIVKTWGGANAQLSLSASQRPWACCPI